MPDPLRQAEFDAAVAELGERFPDFAQLLAREADEQEKQRARKVLLEIAEDGDADDEVRVNAASSVLIGGGW